MIYIIMFLISSLCLHYYSKDRKVYFLFVLALVFPVLLAAYRDVSVGIDTSVYVVPLIKKAINYDFNNFIALAVATHTEVVYSAIIYFLSVLTNGSTEIVFGLTELVIVFFVYRRILDFKDDAPVFVMTMVYLLITYNRSLNLSRQCIAMALIFYATRYLRENKVKYLIFNLTAVMFHNSSVLGLLFIVIDYCIGGRLSRIKSFLFISLSSVAIIFYQSIFPFFAQLIFGVDNKYSHYWANSDSGFLSVWDIIFKLLCIIVAFISMSRIDRGRIKLHLGKEYNVKNSQVKYFDCQFFLIICILNLLFYFTRLFNGDNYRISLYFQTLIPVAVPQIRWAFKNKTMIDLIIISLAFLNWYIFIILSDGYGTFPYVFIK